MDIYCAASRQFGGAALLHSLDTTSSTRKKFEHAYLGRQEGDIAVDDGLGLRQARIHVTA